MIAGVLLRHRLSVSPAAAPKDDPVAAPKSRTGALPGPR